MAKERRDFDNARALCQEYGEMLEKRQPSKPLMSVWGEFRMRIGMLGFVTARVRAMCRSWEEKLQRYLPLVPDALEGDKAAFQTFAEFLDSHRLDEDWHCELRMLQEYFYHCAWRVCELSKMRNYRLPHVSAMDVELVRDARNHMVAHPEKERGVFREDMQSSLGGDQGPTIRRQRSTDPHPHYTDPGFFMTVQAMEESLERTFNRAVACLRQEQASAIVVTDK